MSRLIPIVTQPRVYSVARRWLGTRYYWTFQALGWGAIFLATLAPLPFSKVGITPQAFAANLLLVLLCWGSSHFLRIVVLFLLTRPKGWPAFVCAWFPWALTLGLISSFWFMVAVEALVATDRTLSVEEPFAWGFADYVDTLSLIFPVLSIWTAFYLGARIYRQHRLSQLDQAKAETAAREAELRALKAQINPHFLFNSLNSVRALISDEQERPREAVTRLSELLRASLASNHESLIPLGRELATVENYLALEHLRHEDRLTWRIDVPVETRERPVPPFLLQGLVENAVKHGIDRREEGGEITVVARLESAGLRLKVGNPGVLGITPESVSLGTGLANMRARIGLLFGPEARLELGERAPGRVEADVFLPSLKIEGASNA